MNLKKIKPIIIAFVLFSCEEESDLSVSTIALYRRDYSRGEERLLYEFKLDSVSEFDKGKLYLHFEEDMVRDSILKNTSPAFGGGIDFVLIKSPLKKNGFRIRAKAPYSSYSQEDYVVKEAWLEPFRSENGGLINKDEMLVSYEKEIEKELKSYLE